MRRAPRAASLTPGFSPAVPWARSRAATRPARCQSTPRRAWELFAQSGEAHAAFLEDDVRLSAAAPALLGSDGWIAPGMDVVKLEHYGPPGQRVLADGHSRSSRRRLRRQAASPGRGFSYRPHAVAPYRSGRLSPVTASWRRSCSARRASTCRWIIFCSIPTLRRCSQSPFALAVAAAIGTATGICRRKIGHRSHAVRGLRRLWREPMCGASFRCAFFHDLKLLPRWCLWRCWAARSSWR